MSGHEHEMEATAASGPSVSFAFLVNMGSATTRTTTTLTYTIDQGNHGSSVILETWCVNLGQLAAGTYEAQSFCATQPIVGRKTLTFRVDSGIANRDFLVVSCVLKDSQTLRQIPGVGQSQVIDVGSGSLSTGWSVPAVSWYPAPVLTVRAASAAPGPGGGNQSIAIVPTFQTAAVPGDIPTVDLEVTADPDGETCHFEVMVSQAAEPRAEDVVVTAAISTSPSSLSSTETVTVWLDQPYLIAIANLYDGSGNVLATDSFVWQNGATSRDADYDVSVNSTGTRAELTVSGPS